MQTCAASAASRPSGIATTAVRGVIRSLTGRWANASTPETTAISPAEARAPVSAPESTAAAQLVRHPTRQLELADGRRGHADRGGGAGAEQSKDEDEERERHFRWKQTRVTRRRSTRSTTTRNPSSVSSSPGRGTRPSAE